MMAQRVEARRRQAMRGGSRLVTALTLTMMLMAPSACSELTSVNTSDVVEPGSLENTVGAEALRAGAITLFTNGFAGGDFGRNQITVTGTMADELFATSTNEEHDKRNIVFGGFLDSRLQPARVNALLAIEALQKVAPEPAWRIGELFALVAYTEVLFAENLCSGVPLSAIVNGEPSFGTSLNTVEMLERAVADFDLALASSGDNREISNLARVGRGRALLNLARFDEAATAVTGVPTEFSYATEHSATVQPNGVFRALNTSLFFTVSDNEGTNGVDFRSADDPRVPTRLVGEGSDGTPVFALTDRFTSDASPSVLASGIEARLIEAEAKLQAGDAAGALQKLNELRSTRSDLPPLEQQPIETARVDQLFRERAFWLFLTGHRHGDLRRLIRQYGRQTESVFPTGFYKPGLEYGEDVTLLPDRTEQENPNFDGCFNREA